MMAKRRLIVAMILTYIAFAMLLNSVGTVILQSIGSFDIAKTRASTLEGFKDITIAVISFLIAGYLPRFGLRRSMLGAILLAVAACLFMPLARSFPATQLHFAMVGAAFAVVKITLYSMIGLVTKDGKSHASLTAIIEGMFMVGVLSSYWVFSFFIRPDAPTGDLGWLNSYWVLGGISGLAFLLLLTAPLDERGAVEDGAKKQSIAALFLLLKLPLILVFLFCAFLFVLVEQGVGTWLPTFNNEVIHLSPRLSVQAASIFAASLALGRFLAGAVMTRLSWYPVLNFCLAMLMVLIASIIPATHDLPVQTIAEWGAAPIVAFLFPMIGLFLSPIYPTIVSVMLSAMPKRDHAAIMGLVVVFSALGGTSGSLMTGFIFARLSGQTAFLLMLVPLALLGLGLHALKRRIDRPV